MRMSRAATPTGQAKCQVSLTCGVELHTTRRSRLQSTVRSLHCRTLKLLKLTSTHRALTAYSPGLERTIWNLQNQQRAPQHSIMRTRGVLRYTAARTHVVCPRHTHDRKVPMPCHPYLPYIQPISALPVQPVMTSAGTGGFGSAVNPDCVKR